MKAALVLATLALATVRGQGGDDVVWFIDPSSGEPPETCGHEPSRPCASLGIVFEQSQLVNESGSCFTSQGDRDGRSSTTVYLTGSAFVPAVCLYNWHNLRVSSYPPGSVAVINTDRFGISSIFSFFNCTNVTLEGLVFNTSRQNRQNLYFEDCTDLAIRRCSMPLTAVNGYGVEVRDSGGQVVVEECVFSGDPSVEGGNNHGIALRLVSGSELFDVDELYPAMDVVIRDCEFRDLTSYGPPQDSYRRARSSALSLLVQFRRGASSNLLSVEDSRFHNITNTVGHSVTVHYDSGSFNNSVSFSRCTFEGNRVRYGGGVATYFSGGTESRNGSLYVSDCNFTRNQADFEGGGVFVAFLQEEISNQVFISSCLFQANRALYGAAVFLFNNPAWFSRHGPPDSVALPLTPVNISSCHFSANEASLDEGVITALRIILTLDNATFTDNKGSAVLLRLSLAYLEGQLLFENNTANLGAALSVQDRSRVDMRGAGRAVFRANMAVQGGGAIYGDESSTSFSANEYNHSLAENRFGFCFIIFGNEGQPVGVASQTPGRIVFEENFAFADGGTVSAYSLRGCQIANFVPPSISHFLAVPSDGTNLFRDPEALGSTTTGPSYLFFFGASTRCYKPVGNLTYLLPNCSHSLLNQTFYAHPGLSCSLKAQLSELTRLYGPGAALRPTVDKMVTPWAGVEASWTLTPGGQRLQCGEEGEEEVPGQLLLSPAPGEQFDLTVQLADQLLNYVSATIYLEVEHDSVTTPPGVLLQLNGIQYAFTDRVFFTPNRALSGLALVGLPGSEGRLRVVVASQVRGQNIVLLLPFKLAQCPLGYYPPPGASSLPQVNSLLESTYSYTQRIPEDQPLACSCLNQTSGVQSHLNPQTLSLSHTCIRGYTVELNGILWAGLIPHADSAPLFPPSVPCPVAPPNSQPVTNALTQFILEARANTTFDPVDVVTYERGVHPGGRGPVRCFYANITELVTYRPDGEFSLEFCTRGYCRGNQLSTWFVSDEDYPCISEREGVLCGQCRSGFAVTTYSTTCSDCHDAIPAISILLTLILGLLFVIAVVAFNFEASPTIDSLLFFTQAVYILLAGRANYEAFSYLAFFNPDFTFSLCVTRDLTALGRLGLQYATPLYILSLLLLLLLLTRVKVRWVAEKLGRHSFLKSLWFLILISYLNISLTTFELLHCRTIGPSNGGRRLVLDHDASVTCYHDGHLAAAIFAIFSAVFVVLPFPVFTAVLLHFPRFKPFTDAYTFMYRDWRRLWVAWSLFRRLLLVLIGVFVTDFASRHFSLLLGLMWILLVDVVTWPYRHHYDNFFSLFISWLLVVVAILTEPSLYLYVDPGRGVSGALVVGGVVCGLGLAVVERVLWRRGDSVDGVVGRLVGRWRREGHWGKKPVEGMEGSQVMSASSSLPRYRESLLEQFPLEAGGKREHREEEKREEREKKKGWQWRKKRSGDIGYSLAASSSNSSSVVSTSVGVADLDSGLAHVQYSRHDSN